MHKIKLITSPEYGSSYINIKWDSTIKHFNTILEHIPRPPIILSCTHHKVFLDDAYGNGEEYYDFTIRTTNDERFIEMFNATYALISNNDL